MLKMTIVGRIQKLGTVIIKKPNEITIGDFYRKEILSTRLNIDSILREMQEEKTILKNENRYFNFTFNEM